ncbi:hypothetical protein TIFTF001_050547 [Ficus carica]|uniref:Uncharacterized protein n=1 Tax=Ficus carica TaxID=3494 RepID=A0AA88CRK8_FICCA|nr:hypothetical protein TIFTF001_050547 [Ficus carica]
MLECGLLALGNGGEDVPTPEGKARAEGVVWEGLLDVRPTKQAR